MDFVSCWLFSNGTYFPPPLVYFLNSTTREQLHLAIQNGGYVRYIGSILLILAVRVSVLSMWSILTLRRLNRPCHCVIVQEYHSVSTSISISSLNVNIFKPGLTFVHSKLSREMQHSLWNAATETVPTLFSYSLSLQFPCICYFEVLNFFWIPLSFVMIQHFTEQILIVSNDHALRYVIVGAQLKKSL